MSRYSWLLFVAGMFFFSRCVKDKTVSAKGPIYTVICAQVDSFLVPIKDSIYAFPPSPAPYGWIGSYQRRYQYWNPCFNPGNSNELAYVKWDATNPGLTGEIHIFNLSTGCDQLVSTAGYIAAYPQWASTGWIVFTGADGNIWKIKREGTNLTQLTWGNNFNTMAVVSPGGENILYSQQSPPLVLLINQQGIILDTISALVGGGYWSWGTPDKLATGTPVNPYGYGVGYYDFTSNSIKQVKGFALNAFATNGIEDVHWFRNASQLIYSEVCYLWVTDTASGASTLLSQGGDNVHYGKISIAPGETQIAIEHLSLTPFISDSSHIPFENQEYDIYIMNSDGSGLKRLILPQ